MANAHKTSSAKRKNNVKSKKSSPGSRKKSNATMKKPASLKLTVNQDKKMKYNKENSQLIPDKVVEHTLALNSGKVNKDTLAITKNDLITRNGKIKTNKKSNKKIIDNVLKSELMIEEVKSKKSRKRKSDSTNSNNNNDSMSDQNKSESDSSTPDAKFKRVEKQKNIKANNKTKKSQDVIAERISKLKKVTLSNGLTLTLTLFECDYCQKTFTSKSSLRRHIYVHLGLKEHSCPYCPKKFHQRNNLKVHVKRQHPNSKGIPEQFVCKRCDKRFLGRENYTLHMSNHIKHENDYHCYFCNKKFSYHLLLMQHEKQHVHPGKFKCTICTMSFDARPRLSMHLKSHMDIKEFICQFCGKEFQKPSYITRHVQVSHGGMRIQCPICNKKLTGHLTEHMRIHEKERPHKCEICESSFTQSTQLKVHMRSHTGERPYPCRICKNSFRHSNALMLHIRRHTGEKPFACSLCPLTFAQVPHMKTHMFKIHGKAEPYKCQKCDQFFSFRVDLVAHTKTCTVGDKDLSFEERMQLVQDKMEDEEEPAMSLSRMRFLLALLLTMIASKDKLKYLGFNKRLIDEMLEDSLVAMGHVPCKDESVTPLKRLRTNIQKLLNGTIPKSQMEKFRKENKSTEELLELLTNEKTNSHNRSEALTGSDLELAKQCFNE